MAKKLRKRIFKGKAKDIKEQINEAITSEDIEDNSATVAIKIHLVFEKHDLSPDKLMQISGEMQSFLDESVNDFAREINLSMHKKIPTLTKGQVEAIGRVNGKVFRAILTKEEV